MGDGTIYDACALYPASLRDLLLRLALAGLVTPRWTEQILDEMTAALLRNHDHLDAANLQRTRALMCDAIPDCLVEGFEHRIPELELPDPNDRHVLAAAIHAEGAQIVTANLADFPASALEPHGITAVHPDEFIEGLIDQEPDTVLSVVVEQAATLEQPPQSVDELLERFRRNGLTRCADRLRNLRP